MRHQDLDAHLLAPKRFVTLAHLNHVEYADYPALQEVTGMTTPDLSKIIRDLETRGLVEVKKVRKNRYSHTLVGLSSDGRRQFLRLMWKLNHAGGR